MIDLWEREKRTWPHHDLSRFIEAGGTRWHVQQSGSGPALLLMHGAGASTHSWRGLLPILARNFAVTAADLPGHGFTAPLSGSRSSISGMSEAVAALLRALEFRPQYCVGHSAGAVILCRLALDGHVAPRAIISINGAFVPFGGAAGVFLAPIARLLATSRLLPRVIARRAGNPLNVARVIAGTGSQLDPAGLALYTRLVSNPKHVSGALAMMGNWDLRSFERDLPRLAIPLALLVAENDRTVPPHQALKVLKLVANAVVHRMPDLGHLAHEEQPEMIGAEILRICRTHGNPA